jgi:hypothetical protein
MRWICIIALVLACNDIRGDAVPRPLVHTEPEVVLFPRAPVGALQVRDVTLTNVGDDLLLILPTIALDEAPSLTVSWLEPPGSIITLAPKASVHLVVAWLPAGRATHSRLTLESNAGPVVIPIRAGGGQAELHVTPQLVDFGEVPAHTPVSAAVTLTNLGVAPLGPMEAWLEDTGPRVALRWLDGRRTLPPDGQTQLVVQFSPDDTLPQRGTLVVEVPNEPEVAPLRLPVLANVHRPCVVAQPVHFRTALIGRPSDLTLRVSRCTDEPVQITGVQLTGDAAFTVEPPLLPAVLDTAAPLLLPVHFRPVREGTTQAMVHIESDDPFRPVASVVLTGQGVHNQCPVAHAAARLERETEATTLLLDAGGSTDADAPNRMPVAWRWHVDVRPEQAEAEVQEGPGVPDDATTPTARFTPDAPGLWRLALAVEDAFGCVDESTVSVTVRDGPVDVQLEWATD